MSSTFLKKPNSRSPGTRHNRVVKWGYAGVSCRTSSFKYNRWSHRKYAGRNHTGAITVFGRGGGVKTAFRKVLPLSDFTLLPSLEPSQ